MSLQQAPLERSTILRLAPNRVRSQSAERYRGDTVTTRLGALPEASRKTVRELYDFLVEVYALSQGHLHAPDAGMEALKALTAGPFFSGLIEQVSRLGAELHNDEVPNAVKRSIHDIRGGSLMALIMHLDMIDAGEGAAGDVQRVFILSRDHLKMMRNAIRDLDPERYEADLNERAHAIDLLEEKWRGVRYAGGATVHLHTDFDGVVSQRCMEFSALDRVIYNLVNNAAQHAEDQQVHLVITAIDDQRDTHLRFAVVNRITDAQRDALEERFDDLSELYRGGFTTGGHGIGLRICGDFVTHGYARDSLDRALEDDLLGIDLVDEHFVAWFHWPGQRRAADAKAAK